MGHFWTSFFEHLKHSGRNATLFLIALAGFFVLLSLGAVLYATRLYEYVVPALPFVAIFALVQLVLALRRARARRRLQTPFPPLSQNELHNARSKLRRQRT